MGSMSVKRDRQQPGEFGADKRHSDDGSFQRHIEALIDAEALRFTETSPIVRGTRELSHSLLRIFTSEVIAESCGTGRFSFGRARRCFSDFLASSLMQHARDRGSELQIQGSALDGLVSQIEAWATELIIGRQDPQRVRANIQLALAEELSSRARARPPRDYKDAGDVRVQ